MNKYSILASFYKQIIAPRSFDKDKARREYILNILLVGSVILAFSAYLVTIIHSSIYGSDYKGESPVVMASVIIFLLFLFLLSRAGKSDISARIFISLLLILALYTSYQWGVDTSQALLIYSLIIVMAGILLGSAYAFITTLISGLGIIFLASLEIKGIIQPDYSWKMRTVRMGGAIVFAVTLGIIATVSWLFNRDMEKTLKRARLSEAALKRQRDKLEIAVEKRTKELRRTQAEKLSQLYRFAEFGKSASGLFHDLSNPLNLTSLNLNRLSRHIRKPALSEAKIALRRAIIGTKRLENFIQAARKQVQDKQFKQKFSIKKQVDNSIQLLEQRAREKHITVAFKTKANIETFGNPFRFNQLITNLLSNAIDSYEKIKRRNKLIEVRLSRLENRVKLEIQDWGSGISEKDLSKIFDPLFTTKHLEGTGIGLSICKDVIEKDLKGKCTVQSKKGEGTIFIIEFPLKKSAKS